MGKNGRGGQNCGKMVGGSSRVVGGGVIGGGREGGQNWGKIVGGGKNKG